MVEIAVGLLGYLSFLIVMVFIFIVGVALIEKLDNLIAMARKDKEDNVPEEKED